MWLVSFIIFCVTWLCRSNRERRVLLIENIHSGDIRTVYWHHKGRLWKITLTSKTSAKLSRNTGPGIGASNGVILKYFWLDNKFHNTDTFDIERLSWT